jgi:hypothetical protein
VAKWQLSYHAFDACKERRVGPDELLQTLNFPSHIRQQEGQIGLTYYRNGIWVAALDNGVVKTVGLKGEMKSTWRAAARKRRPLTVEEQERLADLAGAEVGAEPEPKRVRQKRKVHPAVAALGNALDGVDERVRKTIEEQIAALGYGGVKVHSRTRVEIVM